MTWKQWSKRKRLIVLGVVLLLVAAGGLFAYNRFFREEPPPFFASDEEHFLYGSIGTEAEQGLPYWIWLVLPRIFPEHLPGPAATPRLASSVATGTRCRSGSPR